jgi:hypothetical protein
MKPREKASSGLHNEQTVLCYAVRGAHQGFIQEYEKTLRAVLDAPGLDTIGLEPPSPNRRSSAVDLSEKFQQA